MAPLCRDFAARLTVPQAAAYCCTAQPHPVAGTMLVTTPLRLASICALTLLMPHLARAQGGPPGPPAVGTTVVQPQSVTETDEFVGRIQATNRVDLVARVTGFLTKRLFTEGAEVKPGDLLYQIEKPPFEADVMAKTAAVAQANAQLQNASITLGRASSLLNTPAGQRSTVDDATASQRSQAAMLLAAQANLQTSQINLGYTDITAPIAGQDRPHQPDHRQRRRAVDGHDGHHRQPGPDVRAVPDRLADRAGVARPLRRQRRYGGRHHQAQAADRKDLRPGRAYRLHRPDRRRQHRHSEHPRRDPQPVLSQGCSRGRRATATCPMASS